MVKIRLKRMGAHKKPFYRIVVADVRAPRDGKFIEEVGYYDPMKEPKEIKIDEELAKKWLANGAQPTDTVKALFKKMCIRDRAGPELVGSFGSKTAVMNNNQIVESVSRGVYDAVRNAMGSGKGNYTFNITNTLDGREIGKQVIKYHNGVVKQTGVSPLLI